MTNTDVLKNNSYLQTTGNDDGSSQDGWLDKIKNTLGLEEDDVSLRDKISDTLQVDSQGDTSFKPQERAMLLNILRVGALRVDDVMVPRADIIAIDENESVSELLQMFERAGHSRIPLYRDTLDDPMGMVHIKDLMQWITNYSREVSGKSSGSGVDLTPVDLKTTIALTKIRRDVLFVPPSMSVVDLLLRMQTTRVHMALVIDEYGGTDGLVTIEDLVEEIVGEIEDEHDHEDKPLISEASDGTLVANARTPVSDLEERLDKSLIIAEREDEVDTIGGLVFSIVGRVPVKGEIVRHPNGIEFEILDADPRRIKQLKIDANPTDKKIAKKKAVPPASQKRAQEQDLN
ncbi:MAG: hemolysin family protein [Methyloligellaceae bacterium]